MGFTLNDPRNQWEARQLEADMAACFRDSWTTPDAYTHPERWARPAYTHPVSAEDLFLDPINDPKISSITDQMSEKHRNIASELACIIINDPKIACIIDQMSAKDCILVREIASIIIDDPRIASITEQMSAEDRILVRKLAWLLAHKHLVAEQHIAAQIAAQKEWPKRALERQERARTMPPKTRQTRRARWARPADAQAQPSTPTAIDSSNPQQPTATPVISRVYSRSWP